MVVRFVSVNCDEAGWLSDGGVMYEEMELRCRWRHLCESTIDIALPVGHFHKKAKR